MKMSSIPDPFSLVYFVIIPILLCVYQTYNCVNWIRQLCGQSVTNETSNDLELTVQSRTDSIRSNASNVSPRQSMTNNIPTLSNVDLKIKIFTTISIIFGTIYLWLFTMFNYGYVLWSFNIIKNTSINRYRSGYTLIMNGLARYFLYRCYLRRLYSTFKLSFIEISLKKYIILKIMLTLTMVICVVYFIVDNILALEYSIYISNFNFMRLSKYALFSLWDLFWGIYLMIYYLIKLRQGIKMTQMHVSSNDINIITKLSILMTSAVISTQILMVSFILAPLYGQIMVYIDVIINTFSLLYSFEIYNNKYRNHCCVCIYVFSLFT